ncbi:MAG TPA: 2-oxoacid:acceptor oxidoreductase family protein [Bacteroidales bacterium]|jgi:indolepyruvate ferredoxin oxidoreductase alpha subunit|nr:2-oxoacid:acceptor oxidoreductase family protein [Bacteroidales bacterium]
MAKFKDIVNAPPNSSLILQGNTAFALGVIHAGYHAATGYPGTPSTEVIDRSLGTVQDKILVGWSVNEAVAVSVGLGHSMAGMDTLVTMKIPGIFQAGDTLTTTAFFSVEAGALVILAVTDYVPSSTQHVIDARYFFASSRLPVLEPRDHQEMYDIARTAADMSKQFNTPVIVLASGMLAHSEALIKTHEARSVKPKKLPENLKKWMNLPVIARANYNKATTERIPLIKKWADTSQLVNVTYGKEDWGVIVSGDSKIISSEAFNIANIKPSVLSLAITYPIPEAIIVDFASKIKGKLFVIEDGDRFLEEKIRLLGIDVIGKGDLSTITTWTPDDVLSFLSSYKVISYTSDEKEINIKPNLRPPSICPGCQYRAFSLTVKKLKKQKKLYASFGDIGCSTLLYFNKAIDTVSCMGASDSMRQGFVLSRPEMASKVISVIGDSTECHSGLDSTRNGVFRNIPGVKIILDNYITAMTGGQVAPSSSVNLEGRPHRFSLKTAVEAEGGRTVVVDSYNLKEVEKELKKSLELAEKGKYSTLILEGSCIHEAESKDLVRTIKIDDDKCKNCSLCDMCPGIELDENKHPHFTIFCTNCGSNKPVCMQCCPFDAIQYIETGDMEKSEVKALEITKNKQHVKMNMDQIPNSLRLAIRGIGGQGNLFFGKVLAEVTLRTPFIETNIVKGDTHGMAQLGGAVLSTFSCGDVFSPVLANNSADALVVMEISEILRPGFLNLLKKDGTIIINNFSVLPINTKKEEYPKLAEIEKALEDFTVIKVDANQLVFEMGDLLGKSANVLILGVLSSVVPFNLIPVQIWIDALSFISTNETVKSQNKLAFDKGRKYLQNIDKEA